MNGVAVDIKCIKIIYINKGIYPIIGDLDKTAALVQGKEFSMRFYDSVLKVHSLKFTKERSKNP